MKKLLIIVFILALIAGGFYLLSIQPIDEIGILLENIRKETQIDFSEKEANEFGWNVQTEGGIEEIAITGKSFGDDEVSKLNYEKIELFFEENGFEVDMYNIADGTVSGLVGYKVDSIVCVVTSGFTGYKEAEGQWIPPVTDKYDVAIECGKSEEIKSVSDLITEVKTIEVDVSENFLIPFESNPTTGYQWEGEYDEEYLQFVGKEYVAQSTGLGSGGNEIFNFIALKPGETEITFFYSRLWEGETIEETAYNVVIK